LALRFSAHARERMRERGITAREVDEALGHVQVESPGSSAGRVNLWGETAGGVS